jgi:hypothetical protein
MNTLVRKPALLSLAAFLAFLPGVMAGNARAQSGNFEISQNGTSVGTATYNFAATADGYDSSSIVHIDMQGLKYALSKSERLDSANHLVHVQLSGAVNGAAVTVSSAPDSAQILLNTSANGRSSTTRLDPHPAAVFLPDFDPGALETLLALAVAQNNRDLWVILPKNAGTIEAVQLATYPDEEGTLDGKPVVVHHLVATIGGSVTDLFSGPENQLLQAELPQPGFAVVRKGFVLKPPTRPGAAPAAQ